MQTCPNCGEQNSETAKFCQECATSLRSQPALPQEARKIVTVLFCDLVGSTALGERLDSESLREVMDRYFAEMKRIVERHGGIVEKYIGDAVMAVFGLPRVHEDDALRAVRAASDMSVALERLNAELEREWGMSLANRTGVNTGEVVIGDPSSGQRLATGDAVNVAARLEQAAPTNRVLIGGPTYQLVRDAVEVEAVEPLGLKGKTDRLPAFRLIEVRSEVEGIARRLDAPLVGRSEELAGLLDALEAATQENRCHLVTVLGEAGVGKSRLVAELAARVHPQGAVLKGRCLSYGEGITFWPLAEIVRHAAAIGDEDSAEEARRRIDDLLVGMEGGIADRVASVMGLSSVSFPIEESFWAARRLLEHLARDQPLVVIFEDIHWAEPTFLDWIGHVVDLTRAPVLVVCAARPELRDERPTWGQPSPHASLLDLQPLTGSESNVLIDNLLGASGATPEIRVHITAAAQGNPLFVEQIISMWIDDGTISRDNGNWNLRRKAFLSLPPTTSALLSARLDRLHQDERTVVASASVVGQVFYRGAVEELCPPLVKSKVRTSLSVLEAKQFIRPDSYIFAEEQVFSFRHVLIRDAVYAAILKRTRAELHERFASWLERVTGERVPEYEEIVGYHLEQAVFHFRTLGKRVDRIEEVGKRAAHHLSSAGRRALSRGDISGAANLLKRAVALLAQDDESRAVLLPELANALTEGGEFVEAESVLTDAQDVAARCGYEAVAAYAILENARVRRSSEPELTMQEVARDAESVIPVFERLGDERGLARAWNLVAHSFYDLGRISDAEGAWQKAIEQAECINDRRELAESFSWLAIANAFGPTPAPRAIEICDAILKRARGDRRVLGHVLDGRSALEAMLGHFDQARDCARRARAAYEDLGLKVMAANLPQNSGYVEMLAGDVVAAEREYRKGYRHLDQLGERGFLSSVAALLADALFTQGRIDEAEQFTHIAQAAATEDDVTAQVQWRSARAKVLAKKGDFDTAQHLAREAVAQVNGTEFLHDRAEAHMALAEVLTRTEEPIEAGRAAMQALKLYEQKGNIVSAAKARKLLEQLTSNASAWPS